MTNIFWALYPVFAEVSKNKSILCSLANSSAIALSMTLLSSKSTLFPIKNIFKYGWVWDFISSNHDSKLSKDSWLSIAYTIIANEEFL